MKSIFRDNIRNRAKSAITEYIDALKDMSSFINQVRDVNILTHCIYFFDNLQFYSLLSLTNFNKKYPTI